MTRLDSTPSALFVASLGAAIVAAMGCSDAQPTAYNLSEPPASTPEPVETRWADFSGRVPDLPVGEELDIRIWHERAGVIKKWTGTLGPEGVELPEIRLSTSQLD